MADAINLFFLGKGGVGKSTSSALYSVALADKGFKVLLVSLDPAHNQGDIFAVPISSKPVAILPNLHVLEIDQDKWVKHYLSDVHQQLRHSYSYLSAFNLDHHFKVLKYSPGLEEYALLLAFKEITKKYRNYDYLLFDMPPTALALKFFNLPRLSLLWLEQLLTLRREILKKKEMITTVKWGKQEKEQDKVLNRISSMQLEHTELQQIFQDRTKTLVQLVLNDDKLSLAESKRIVTGLQQIDIDLNCLVKNKTKIHNEPASTDPLFTKITAIEIPLSQEPLIGLDNLQRFLHNNHAGFPQQLLHRCKKYEDKAGNNQFKQCQCYSGNKPE